MAVTVVVETEVVVTVLGAPHCPVGAAGVLALEELEPPHGAAGELLLPTGLTGWLLEAPALLQSCH